jgi:hypothetical protein
MFRDVSADEGVCAHIGVILGRGVPYPYSMTALQRLTRAWRTGSLWVQLAFFFVAGGWLLVVRPQLNAGPAGVITRVALFVLRYLIFWAGLWLVVWLIDPGLLVGSRTGLQTLFQVLPPTVVAVLVLILGAVFVIAQVVTSTWGTRAPVMITLDQQVVFVVARPLLILMASLLLSGQVPDEGSPSAAVTAAAAVIVLATIRMLVIAATSFPASIQKYIGPRTFAQFVVSNVRRECDGGALGLVVFRTGLLAEMLRMALRRGDSVAVSSTLEAIADFQASYLASRENQPALRDFRTEDGSVREGWLASDLQRGLVAAGEEALRVGASADDGNAICRTMARLADQFDNAGEFPDALRCIDDLTELATNYLQISISGTTNLFTEPVFQLAWVEANAEDRSHRDTASYALAGWALGAAYARYHLQRELHPMRPRSIQVFGPHPPWEETIALVARDGDWQQRWVNKLSEPGSLVQVMAEIMSAAQQHAEQHGRPRPSFLPPDAPGS